MANKEKKSGIVANTLVMLVAALVCVTLLAVVNQITRGPIKDAEVAARAESYAMVYAGAGSFEEVENTEEMLEKSPELLASAGYEGCFVNDVLAVKDSSGSDAGYVIAATSPNGYGGEIQVAIGINADGKLTGMGVITHTETAGLGSKTAEPDFTNQFKDLSASKIEYSKSGADKTKNEIDAIGGATISSAAVTEAVNAAIVFYQENFAGGIQAEPEIDPVEESFPDADLSTVKDVEVVPTETKAYTVNEVKEVPSHGYVITVTAHEAYHGDLKIAVAIGTDGIIKKYVAVENNETKGLGDQCGSPEFAKQFEGLKADKVTKVPSGANPENNEIDALASATITTNAVLAAVNGAVDYYNAQLKGE